YFRPDRWFHLRLDVLVLLDCYGDGRCRRYYWLHSVLVARYRAVDTGSVDNFITARIKSRGSSPLWSVGILVRNHQASGYYRAHPRRRGDGYFALPVPRWRYRRGFKSYRPWRLLPERNHGLPCRIPDCYLRLRRRGARRYRCRRNQRPRKESSSRD